MTRLELIRERLNTALRPLHCELQDDSAAHAGHAGAASGGGHFSAVIVAECFAGKGLVARHRLVYNALGELMGREIHAFSMRVLTPSEFTEQQGTS